MAFSLGIKEEWWSSDIGALVIPCGVDVVLVHALPVGFEIVYREKTQKVEELLMTACIVQDYLDGKP